MSLFKIRDNKDGLAYINLDNINWLSAPEKLRYNKWYICINDDIVYFDTKEDRDIVFQKIYRKLGL